MPGRSDLEVKRLFRKLASPAILIFGFLCGSLYASGVYLGYPGAALFALGTMLFSSGAMALVYFFSETAGEADVPYLVEALKIKALVFLPGGVAYVLRSFSDIYVPPYDPLSALSYFFSGATIGAIFAVNLLFLVSLRYRVASWRVIPFPRWLVLALRWAGKRVLRIG